MPAPDALATAHREALLRLARKTTDPARRKELEWSAELPATATPPGHPGQLAGTYGDVRITHHGARLFYQGPGGPQRLMLPLSPATFLIEGLEDRRLRLTTQPPALVIERSTGEIETRDRFRR